jgi:2-polyprenyl-6-methoxyphenol hydroxylase-like FAD-dependent oxidoreductase
MPNSKVNQIPVAIAGGGPVGLMLALFLDHYGVRSVIFNSEREVRRHPKGSTHNSRTMEHHRRLGIAPQVRNLSLPIDRPTDVSYYTRLTGWELGRLRLPSEAEKRRAVAASSATDQIPEPLLRANQMYVEAFLLEHARTRGNITVRFGCPVTGFQEDDDGVTVEAEAAAGGGKEIWRAQYLAGCDGGRSFVRRSLALRYNGFAKLDSPHYGGRMNATYLRAPTLYRDHLAHRPGWNYWVVNPELRYVLITLNDPDDFLVFSKGSDEGIAPTDEEMASLVRRGVGADLPIRILGHWPWTAGVALVAERFVAGRVALAGDAAHLFTPTGGFGMNTGMDDASNLAWKLAALVQGWGGPGLLPSYEIERRPIAERNTIAARELNKHLIAMPAPPEMEDDTPAGEAARRKVSAHLMTMGEEFASIGVQLGARYDGSPIVAGNGAPPGDDYVRYVPSGVPGGRAPHFWLDEGRGYGSSLFDRLGKGFTLLRLGGKAPDAAPIRTAAAARNIPLAVLDVPGPDARDLYGRDLALIRPDQYLAWSGNTPAADPGRLMARLTGTT